LAARLIPRGFLVPVIMMFPKSDHHFRQRRGFDLSAGHNGPNRLAIKPGVSRRLSQATHPDLRHKTFVRGDASTVIVNTTIIDVFDKVICALFEPGNLFSNAML
jgi:hypothetical protein